MDQPKSNADASINSASAGSPDPLALSLDGRRDERPAPAEVLRAKSPNKPRASRSRQTPPAQQLHNHAIPRSKQAHEMVITTPSKRSAPGPSGSDGQRSPWKIRVTVEAEQDDTSPKMERGSPTRVRTTKVPLNDAAPKVTAAKGTPKKRGRPRKNDVRPATDNAPQSEDSNEVVKRLRPSLPARTGRRQSGLVNEILPDENEDEVPESMKPQPATENMQTKRPARPRKHELTAADSLPNDSPTPSPKKRKLQPFRGSPFTRSPPTSQRAFETQAGHEIRQIGFSPALSPVQDVNEGSITSDAPQANDTLNLGENTIELDRSAVESEGFSIVSLESLRSRSEQINRQKQQNSHGQSQYNVQHEGNVRAQALPEATRSSHDHTASPTSQPVQHIPPPSISYPELPSIGSAGPVSSSHTHSPASPPETDSFVRPQRRPEHSTGQARSADPWSVFSDRTRRELRHSFAVGEQLAQQDLQTNSQHQPAQSPSVEDFARLPTPADSVDAAGPTGARTNTSDPAIARLADEMSWRLEPEVQYRSHHGHKKTSPEPQSSMSEQAVNARDNASVRNSLPDQADIWRDEADRSLDDSMGAQRERQRSRRLPNSQLDEAQMQLQGLEPLPVKHLKPKADGPQNASSQKPQIRPFNNATQPSPIPSLSDLLPSDDKPARGKIPRTWRRISDSDFLYPDEANGSPEQKLPCKPAFASPGEPIDPAYPSLFQRLGFTSGSKAQDARSSAAVTNASKLAEEEQIEPRESSETGGHDRHCTPELRPPPRKSILSSPARRSVSPAKSVTWRHDDSLEETHVDDTQYSSSYLRSREYDGPEDAEEDVEEEEDEDANDTSLEETHDYSSMADDINISMNDESNIDSSALLSSPLQSRGRPLRRRDSLIFSPSSSTATDLPDSVSSHDDDIQHHAIAMSHSATKACPQIPNTALPASEYTSSQGLLSRISSYFFSAAPVTPSDPNALIPGPHLWTRQHQILLDTYFVQLSALNQTVPFRYDNASKKYILHYVHPPHPAAAPLPRAFFVAPDAIPPSFRCEIGKTYRNIPSCDRGPVCGPNCPGVPAPLRWRLYSRTITEGDARLAFAVSVMMAVRGVPGTNLDRSTQRDHAGHIVRHKQDWSAKREAKALVWRVFGDWVGRSMERDLQNVTVAEEELKCLAADEGVEGQLWREREMFGL